jgi:hypothetical protein
MRSFPYSRAFLPLIPPTPFSHKGRRGSLGVLMPETGDGARGLSKKLRLRAFFYTGRGGSLFVLKPKE